MTFKDRSQPEATVGYDAKPKFDSQSICLLLEVIRTVEGNPKDLYFAFNWAGALGIWHFSPLPSIVLQHYF